jgi:hypothetical protein
MTAKARGSRDEHWATLEASGYQDGLTPIERALVGALVSAIVKELQEAPGAPARHPAA